ncbi:unnamed protein product [Angiostrongylus costaricensis]|uniref:Carbonic anhydrase n=1 Tax=Angiostrongylus costaricensis TaxID=334426 RepID=A0A0R3PED9_ANGCS|nr:unnamed protein product [Angiostrongylus costaricensis]
MFVVRNAGNMIPDTSRYGFTLEVSVTTEPAALELAMSRGGVRHIIVCGHSDCKAMNLLHSLHQCLKTFDVNSPMDHWVRRNRFNSIKRLHERLHEGPKIMKFESELIPSENFEVVIDPLEELSINVLQQLINIMSYEFLRRHFETGRLFVHGMWFDINNGDDYLFSKKQKLFVLVHVGFLDCLHICSNNFPIF